MQAFKSEKGIGFIEILVAIVFLAMVVAVGYVVVQGMNSSPEQHDEHIEHSDSSDHEHHQDMHMASYQNEAYGFSFDYPESWEVNEVDDVQPSEPLVALLNEHGERRLSIFDDAAVGCEEVPSGNEEETALTVGDSEVKVAKNCNQGWGFLTADPVVGDATLTFSLGEFIGSTDEGDVRHVLETVEGLSNVKPLMPTE